MDQGPQKRDARGYRHEVEPILVKVCVGDDANGVSKGQLQNGRDHGDQSNDLGFDEIAVVSSDDLLIGGIVLERHYVSNNNIMAKGWKRVRTFQCWRTKFLKKRAAAWRMGSETSGEAMRWSRLVRNSGRVFASLFSVDSAAAKLASAETKTTNCDESTLFCIGRIEGLLKHLSQSRLSCHCCRDTPALFPLTHTHTHSAPSALRFLRYTNKEGDVL